MKKTNLLFCIIIKTKKQKKTNNTGVGVILLGLGQDRIFPQFVFHGIGMGEVFFFFWEWK